MKKVLIKKSPIFPPAVGRLAGTTAIFNHSEIVRKSLHFLIALVPAVALINFQLAVLALISGIMAYTVMEYLRLSGVTVPLISAITVIASRKRDIGHFVLGPVTLGFGALISLLAFPFRAAVIGIFALAFGDGLAGLIGKMGKNRPAFLFGKSVEGSIACFSAVFVSAYLVSRNAGLSLAAALTATAVEALPLKDYDNIAIPIAVSLVAALF